MMITKRIRALLALALLTSFFGIAAPQASAKEMDSSVGYVFAGFGSVLIFGNYRVGFENVEAGLFPFGLGLGYVGRTSARNSYPSIGVMLAPDGNPGLYGAVGYELPIVGFLDLRGELTAGASISGFMAAGAIIGATLHI